MEQPSAEDPSIDRDLAELEEIGRRLDETVDINERISLRDRQRELRSRWTTDHGSQSTERLLDLENALDAQRTDLLRRRLEIASTGNGSDSGGLDPLSTVQHNRLLDETQGRADIEKQLLEVRTELRRREAAN